ncbi:MAG: hypothetical protein IT452_06245 [Planctomycetia bacterium]|nr:hypothetical protein [Planctomycetia bacterium]
MSKHGNMADELLEKARSLSGVLTARGITHAFIGGLAMNAWSIPAPTYDIDLCAALDPADVPGLIADLDRAGFVPPPTAWLNSVGAARFQEFSVHWPVGAGLRAADIFLATDGFQQSALTRRRPVDLAEGFRTFVVSPEDLLIYKLVAWRPKDRAAIERLLAVQSALEWTYVREWAGRLGVTPRLEEALKESGLRP